MSCDARRLGGSRVTPAARLPAAAPLRTMSPPAYGDLFPTCDAARAKRDGQPFTLPDLWRESAFTDASAGATLFAPFSFASPAPPPVADPAPAFSRPPAELRLPPFPGLNAGLWPAQSADADARSAAAASSDTAGDGGARARDVWLDPATAAAAAPPRFYTWESFLGGGGGANALLSEAGPGVLDAALGDAGAVVRADVFSMVSSGRARRRRGRGLTRAVLAEPGAGPQLAAVRLRPRGARVPAGARAAARAGRDGGRDG